jgi:type IV secretion system protein VirB10
MSEEAVIERGDAPVARAASPLWKWAFIGTLIALGVGTLAAVLRSELRAPEAPAAEENARPRLRFDTGQFEPPVFARPEPAAQEPPPPPAPVAIPESPTVPELPLPEPRHEPAPRMLPPPAPAIAEKHVETPEELAEKRRLSAPLSGAGVGSPSVASARDEDGAGRDRGGLDLSVTKTSTAFARRLSDLTFVLPKGSYLNCILDTAIQSDQAGLVGCTLPEDVYGADGTVVLLDRGSQVLGEYRSATLTYGKRRIFVVWDRVRTPEGVVVDIASPGIGPLGQAGLGGRIDNHYWERVGIPVLMSAVSFGVESYTREALTPDESNYLQQTTDNGLSGVLGELARIKPTLHKSQGDPISIIVSRDLDLSPVYELRRRHGR